MKAIVRATARWAAATLGALAALVLLSATVRLLPWALAPDVAWGPLGVFARGVLVVGFETALLVALPVAWALAAASLNDQGEARACMLSGASPWALARATVPLGLLLSIVMLWPSALWGRDASQAGVVVRGLVHSAREGCDPTLRPVSEVPLARATWLCPPEAPARLAAALGTNLVASVEGVRVAEDLRTLWAEGISLDVRGPPLVHLQAREGLLTGLPPFARAAGPSQKLRPWFVVAGALVGALAVMASILRRGEAKRALALGLGGASSASGLGLMVGAERLGLGPIWYAALPAAMAAPPLLWQTGLGLAQRWRRRRLLRGPLRPFETLNAEPEASPPTDEGPPQAAEAPVEPSGEGPSEAQPSGEGPNEGQPSGKGPNEGSSERSQKGEGDDVLRQGRGRRGRTRGPTRTRPKERLSRHRPAQIAGESAGRGTLRGIAAGGKGERMGRLGFGEILIIALVALLLFGASRISDIGKGLGEGIKNFKKGLRDSDEDDEPKQLPKAGEEGEKKA